MFSSIDDQKDAPVLVLDPRTVLRQPNFVVDEYAIDSADDDLESKSL